MKEVAPAILEKDFKEIKNKLALFQGRTKTAQIDFCDGVFVPSSTWPFASGGFSDPDFKKIINEEEGMPYWQDFDFEFDMMTLDAVENFDVYLALGPKRIIFHLAAQKDPQEFEEFLEGIDPYIRENTEIGLAILPNADRALVSRLAGKLDFIQCMGIDKVGFQKQPFNEKVLANLEYFKKNLPGIALAVDGGVNLDNAPALLRAGADRLAVGSAIVKAPDPLGALENFKNLLQ